MTQITKEYFEGKEEWSPSGDYKEVYYFDIDKSYLFLMFDLRNKRLDIVRDGKISVKTITTTEELEEKIEHAKQLFS
jgi:hypothetical protein